MRNFSSFLPIAEKYHAQLSEIEGSYAIKELAILWIGSDTIIFFCFLFDGLGISVGVG